MFRNGMRQQRGMRERLLECVLALLSLWVFGGSRAWGQSPDETKTKPFMLEEAVDATTTAPKRLKGKMTPSRMQGKSAFGRKLTR